VTHLFWTVHGENSSLYDADHTITSLSQTENTPSIDMPNLTDLLLLQMNSLGFNLVPLLAVFETLHSGAVAANDRISFEFPVR